MQRFECGQKPGIVLPITRQDTQTPCLPVSFDQITQSSKGRDYSEQKTLGKEG